MNKEKYDKKKYSAEYISYVENGESAAVYITRDIVDAIDTKGQWIDIIQSKGDKNVDRRWDFEWFTIELFPRINQPDYPSGASEDDKKYITWQTAHKDIENLRAVGFKGQKYKIWPKLVCNKKKCVGRDGKKKIEIKWDYYIEKIKIL
jgi:hypothetical protein